MGKPHERKTNAMRVLDAAGIAYEFRTFSCEQALSGVEVAACWGWIPHACSRRSSPWENPESTTCSWSPWPKSST